MKSTNLIIAISELWNDKQCAAVRNCLLRGIEEINKKFPLNDIIDELNSKSIDNDIELESCRVQLLIDADKFNLLNAVKELQSGDRLLILYVGAVTAPWGQWLLSDGLVSTSDVTQAVNNEHCKLVVATLAPCDDWLATEKKHGDSVTVCNYDMMESGDPIALGLSDFIDNVCRRLKVTPCSIKRPDSMSFLKAAKPSVCGFLDKGSSAMPCLFLIDGFSMLFNLGYGRNPEVRHQLKYIAQLDAALLSHVGYSNILPLSCTAQDPESVKINHLFLPCGGANLDDKVYVDSESPYVVDLNNEMTKVLSGYKERGTSVSTLSIKGKSGAPLSATQIKPIQLFHKIGYGSLELIPLAPFEEDADVKKSFDDIKKGKYANESQSKSIATSMSVLILWKPFHSKASIKKLLYIGPKSQLRKTLPSVITALYNNHDCLKQADHTVVDGAPKKPAVRKTPVVKTAPVKANGTSTEAHVKKVVDTTASSGDKSSRPATATETGTKKTVATPRPATTAAAVTVQKHKSDPQPTKRPNTMSTLKSKPGEVNKKQESTKTGEIKKTESTKTGEIKKTESTKTGEIKKTTESNKSGDVKKTESNKTKDVKKPQTKTTGSVKHSMKATVPAAKVVEAKKPLENEAEHVELNIAANGGDDEHSKTVVTDIDAVGALGQGDVLTDSNKMVSVGTVECAITEHGEADFCDDTPEEYSAEQMKELGLYDDDEDRSSAPVSDRNDLDGADDHMADSAQGNIAHLPMEGSYYGKETFDDVKSPTWNEPLGMPLPARGDSAAAAGAKKPTKCATPINVDCVCVPSDLDKEDLRCLFNHVRFETAFLQIEKCADLSRSVELLMEEWGPVEGAGKETTVIPSLEDDSSMLWVQDNVARLSSCKIKVAAALSRCSILIGGEQVDSSCLGYRCDL